MNFSTLAAFFKASPYLGGLALIVFGVYSYVSLNNKLHKMDKDFTNYRVQVEQEAEKLKNTNRIATEAFKLKLTNTVEHYETINSKLKRQLRAKDIIINGLNSDVDQLQNSLRSALIRQSNNTRDTITTTTTLRDAYTACVRDFGQLRLACGITTNQYNLLRSWSDEVCNNPLIDCIK